LEGDSEMNQNAEQGTCYLRWIHELLFSIYFSVVVVSAEETRSLSWATTLRLFDYSHRYPGVARPIDDPRGERFIMFVLVWFIAGAVFLSLRLLARHPFTRVILNPFAGFVALAGLPCAFLYSGYGNRTILIEEIAISGIAVFLYTFRKWQLPAWFGIGLLVIYFGISTWFAWNSWNTFPLGFYILWPSWDWILFAWVQTRAIYPLVGFCSAVIWAMYVRQSTNTGTAS
jgi:hypothetical protein